MRPAPPVFRRFPGCARVLFFPALLSGNTFGATWWSDAKMEAPMLPQEPSLCRCPTDDSLHWVEDGEILCDDEWEPAEREEDPRWGRHEFRAELTEADWHRALELGLGTDPTRHLTLLQGAWQAWNDPLRESTARPDPAAFYTPARVRVLEEMAQPHPEFPTLAPLRVEALRCLGRFDEAAAALRQLQPRDWPASLVPKFENHLRAGDRFVFAL